MKIFCPFAGLDCFFPSFCRMWRWWGTSIMVRFITCASIFSQTSLTLYRWYIYKYSGLRCIVFKRIIQRQMCTFTAVHPVLWRIWYSLPSLDSTWTFFRTFLLYHWKIAIFWIRPGILGWPWCAKPLPQSLWRWKHCMGWCLRSGLIPQGGHFHILSLEF